MKNTMNCLPGRCWLMSAALLLSAHPSSAMNYDQASKRAAGEMVECAAFYLTGSIELDKQGHAKEANQFEGFARYALDLARATLPMASVQKKLAAAQEANAEVLKGGSLSPLVAKYGDSCKTLLEKPGARADYWRDQDE